MTANLTWEKSRCFEKTGYDNICKVFGTNSERERNIDREFVDLC
jgi:hypothetical protein